MPKHIRYMQYFLPIYILLGILSIYIPVYISIILWTISIAIQAILQEYILYIPYDIINKEITNNTPISPGGSITITGMNIQHANTPVPHALTGDILLTINGQSTPYGIVHIPFTANIRTNVYLHIPTHTIRVEKIHIEDITCHGIKMINNKYRVPDEYQKILTKYLSIFDLYDLNTLPMGMGRTVNQVGIGQEYMHIYIQPWRLFMAKHSTDTKKQPPGK